jgi:hypothetical protein
MDAETGVHTQLLATYGTNEAADKFKGEPGYGVDEGEGYFTQYGCWDKENGVANGKGIWLTSSTGNLVFYDTRSGKVEINGNVSQKKVRKSGGVEWMKDRIAMHARRITCRINVQIYLHN